MVKTPPFLCSLYSQIFWELFYKVAKIYIIVKMVKDWQIFHVVWNI